ncbi:hypothetical protein [Pseudoalteromonas denitrificans]|jgi:hypothetical protein|uniref:Entry exclusion lipoprotein TrbK n=1 Tax=Pseudoalteromonas denitrificans DSM 6059 TaxID=1123010 RepID=A0A1I1I0Q9_9GAMM|nr:hypothetical protein [Pseudoalteromonas denitrificans]SFC29746.1 hypothetical protein SAMN02745724_01330 [Pseudoalteromonas denitrificans DSM 6059]
MKLISITLVVSVLVLMAGCSSTENNEKSNLQASNEQVKKDDRICRIEKSTGSRIGRKVCRTPAQIKEERRIAKEMIRKSITGGRLSQKG